MSAAFEQFHDLVSARGSSAPPGSKDKLAETKRAEREAKLLHHREQAAAKEKREAERLAEAAAARAERAYNGHSKRHVRDAKEAERRQAHRETGRMCEHGVWRCAICFPPPRTDK